MANINLERRSEIGKERRQKTRRKIMNAAFKVFAEKGFDSPTTDDLIAEAGVARGTFYSCFETKEEVMRCVAREFVDSIEVGFSGILDGIEDPAERIALRVRFLCQRSIESPVWGWLIIRIIPTGPLGTSSRSGFLADLARGEKVGRLSIQSAQSALDLIQGAVVMGVRSAISAKIDSLAHIDHLIVSILRGLGVARLKSMTLSNKTHASYKAYLFHEEQATG